MILIITLLSLSLSLPFQMHRVSRDLEAGPATVRYGGARPTNQAEARPIGRAAAPDEGERAEGGRAEEEATGLNWP